MPFLGSLIAGVGSVVSTVAPIVGAYQSIAALTPRPTVTPQRISWMQPTPFYRRKYYTPSYRTPSYSTMPINPGYLPYRLLAQVHSVPSADDFAQVRADREGDRGWH